MDPGFTPCGYIANLLNRQPFNFNCTLRPRTLVINATQGAIRVAIKSSSLVRIEKFIDALEAAKYEQK
jgi:hypothetical protein